MPYLIAILVALSVALVVVLVADLLAADEGDVVARRLERMRGRTREAGPRERRPTLVRGPLERALRALGERFVAARPDGESRRALLGQAGYREAGALPMYYAIRALLMVGLALLSLLVLPFAGEEPLLGLLAIPYAIVVGWFAPRFWVRRKVTTRQAELQRALPDTLDLLVVCVEAGLGLNQALVRVAREIQPVSPVMAAELGLLNLEIRAGTPRDEAFRHLGERTGAEDLRALASMLIQADRFGTSISQALRVQAETLRTKRRQRAEEAAAKTTIKLVFPLVFFIFPALFVVVLGPAAISMLRQLSSLE